jgi:antitoxin MazE
MHSSIEECLNYVYTSAMKATIQKWGNSLGVRIPSIMAKDLMLEHGSEVELIEEDDRIIIQPPKAPRLEDLLKAINESNIHEEIETHGPHGSEAW